MESLGAGAKSDGVENIVVSLDKLESKRDKLCTEATVPDKLEETKDFPCNDSYQFSEEKYVHMDKEGYILMDRNPVKSDIGRLYENQQGADDYEGELHTKSTYILLYIVPLPFTI